MPLKKNIKFFLLSEILSMEILVSWTIDPFIIDFYEVLKLSIVLTIVFHQKDLFQIVDKEITYLIRNINSKLLSVDYNWFKKTKKAIALVLNQQKIPMD